MRMLQEKINKAIDVLDNNLGYLFDLLLEINVAPITHKYCNTAMAVVDRDGRKHIFVSDKLIREVQDYELQLIIYHELMHIVYGHLEDISDLTKKFYMRPDLAGIAMDTVINEVIGLLPKNVEHEALKGVITPEYVSKLVGRKVSCKTHSVEEIFDLLLEVDEQGKLPDQLKEFDIGLTDIALFPQEVQDEIQNILGGSGAKSKADSNEHSSDGGSSSVYGGFTGSGDSESGDTGHSDDSESNGDTDQGEGELGSNRSSDANSQNDALEIAGKHYCKHTSSKDGPAFTKKLEGINSNRKITSQIKGILKQVKINKKNTIKRPNRRFPNNPIGRTKLVGQKVLIGVDVSGSMSRSIIQGNVARTIRSCMASDIQLDIVWGDTRELGRERNINRNFDLHKIRGGGGTELSFMFKNLDEYSALICITDGYFDHSVLTEKQKSVSLFLLVDDGGCRPIHGAKNIDALTGDIIK